MFSVVNYVFPHYDVTRVTGVEVKRVDKDGPITKSNPADGPTRDVYYINTQNDDGKIMVYRNEDTRWGSRSTSNLAQPIYRLKRRLWVMTTNLCKLNTMVGVLRSWMNIVMQPQLKKLLLMTHQAIRLFRGFYMYSCWRHYFCLSNLFVAGLTAISNIPNGRKVRSFSFIFLSNDYGIISYYFGNCGFNFK